MFPRRSSQSWPWEYGIGKGPGGDLQFERRRVPPLSVQNQALQADLILANHYLTQEKERSFWLQRQLHEVESARRASEQQRHNLEIEISDLEADYNRLEEKNQRANNRIQDLRRERRRLTERLEFFIYNERVDYRRRRALERDIDHIKTELREKIQQADNLGQQLVARGRDLSAARATINTLRITIAEKDAEIAQLRRNWESSIWN